MKNKNYKLLESLVKIPSPSGFEKEVAEFIREELLDIGVPRTRVKIDNQGNVIATIKGTSDKTVMIDAHMDLIGFVVNNIDKDGIISIAGIGGACNAVLTARELVILTSKGKINAVVDRKHSHLVEEEEEEEIINKIHEAVIDIGIRKRKKVASIIKIGDPIVFKPSLNHLREGYYSGYGFDDKTGCFILMETIRQLLKSKKKPIPNLVFTFLCQEEVGGGKIKPLLKKYRPQLFIEADVTFATDYPCVDDRQVGKCELGKGIVLYRGVDIDIDTTKLLESTARTHKIKTQIQATGGGIGYTVDDVTPYGIKAVILGIPLRNMHSPTEIINLKDLKSGIDLLTNFLLHKRLKNIL
jgi:endoglucanase